MLEVFFNLKFFTQYGLSLSEPGAVLHACVEYIMKISVVFCKHAVYELQDNNDYIIIFSRLYLFCVGGNLTAPFLRWRI